MKSRSERADPQAFEVTADADGERLDRWLAHTAGVSRRQARLLIATGRVCIGGKPVRIVSKPLRAGRRVEIRGASRDESSGDKAAALNRPCGVPDPTAAGPAAQHEAASGSRRRGEASGGQDSGESAGVRGGGHREPRILYSDRWLVALDKPAGLLSEQDRQRGPSLESVVPKLLQSRGERSRLWLVHRLDAPTSGVIVMARTAAAMRRLADAFRHGEVHKEYLALCSGELAQRCEVNAPIGRTAGMRHGVRQGGKPSATVFEPIVHTAAASLVRAKPRTGRTHQIRVHLAHLGHPIFGDRLYGGPGYTTGDVPEPIGRTMLHAARLSLPHPHSGERVVFEAPVPNDFVRLAVLYGLEAAVLHGP